MALTGLFLCTFLLEHLYGNILLYNNDGGEAFDEYSHSMVHNLLIRIVEVLLFAAIIVHAFQGIVLTRKNAAARPVNYAIKKDSETSSWFSRNMMLTGAFVLFFIVVHLYSFFVPYRISGLDEGQAVSQLVKESFENGWYSLFYFVSVLLLASHLNHGFQSAFQTMGINNKKYSPLIKIGGTAFAVLIFLGFASFPVVFYFGWMG